MENEILNIDFSTSNDELNWVYPSSAVIETVDNKLVLSFGNSSDSFIRNIGTVTPTNNRLRLSCNLGVELFSSVAEIDIEFQIINTVGNVVFNAFATLEQLDDGSTFGYFLDRVFEYDSTVTDIRLRILVPVGYENIIRLENLKVSDYLYNIESVRTYFSIDGLLSESQTAFTSAIQLTSFEVGGVETLTPVFFSDNSVIGGNTSSNWYYCHANLDGSNREATGTPINSFNPFVRDFGLEFDASNYYGGKPLGTLNGNDYGSGVLNFGIDKPTVLNGDLNEHDGVFFLDIDYSKDLQVMFNVLMNDKTNIFDSPTVFRKYVISWDSVRCERNFYYVDQNTNEQSDENHNGFLSGLTPFVNTGIVVGCDESFAPSGNAGEFTYTMDFGTGTGQVGIEYNAFSVPDRFVVTWNGQVYDTGYVGSSSSDASLIAQGIDPSLINTASPSNGAGTLTFNKDSAFPRTATIQVFGSSGTGWNVKGICSGEFEEPDPVDDVVENRVSLKYPPTYQYVGNAFTDPLGTFLSIEVLNELEFLVPLTGNDEVDITIDYDVQQDGDGQSVLSIIKNLVETVIEDVTPSSPNSQVTGSYTFKALAGDSIFIRRYIAHTKATSGSNGGRIEFTSQSLNVVSGSYSPFTFGNFGSILQR